ncbi:uncharacterized protein BJ171DRAFT_633929 [Polychytrium aggregatum]|uniref:uncharacterized protein n=1 Tax=Polychytrium aggregatum TaxID=110093 RepID=UPI0022FDED3F|nr:uncharacterized protein BJ171DRAFT_633929 [Polychytrium aggregatum]KAI9208140.1 hypothetical protein BJ171DRAFT_633929 [Polychytrium aggregatum]
MAERCPIMAVINPVAAAPSIQSIIRKTLLESRLGKRTRLNPLLPSPFPIASSTNTSTNMNYAFFKRGIPLEVYPIFGMISCAVAFGCYVAQKKFRYDQDLRIREDKGYNPHHWAHRISGFN